MSLLHPGHLGLLWLGAPFDADSDDEDESSAAATATAAAKGAAGGFSLEDVELSSGATAVAFTTGSLGALLICVARRE